MTHYAALAEYRHRVAEQYAAVRANPNPAAAWIAWRAARDDLFRQHPMSALDDARRAGFQGIPYAPYDPAWRFVLPVDTQVKPEAFTGELPEGTIRYMRCGRVQFTAPTGETGTLSLFWIQGYGGGIFLPFRDTTNGSTTHGGGRYLLDTIKGADLGITPDTIVIDFNFAYHPSCYYSPRWICPLAPPENYLAFPVSAGEQQR